MKKTYDFVDFWKLFFAVSIVALHTGAFRDFSPEVSFTLFSLFSRLAVPFFFCAGGFFLFSKWRGADQPQFRIAGKQAKRVLILYGIWTGIKFLYTIGRVVLQRGAVLTVVSTYFHDILTLNDGPYWYLEVQILMTLLLGLLCTTKKRTYVLTGIFAVFYSFLLALEYVPADVDIAILSSAKMFFNIHGYIFKLVVGGLFLSIGGCVFYWKEKRSSLKTDKQVVGLALGFLLFIAEIGLVFLLGRTDYDHISYFFALPIISTFLLQLVISLNASLKHAKLWRNLSILIYVTHYITRGFVGFLAGISYFLYFVAVLAISVIAGLIILKLSQKYKVFRWLY